MELQLFSDLELGEVRRCFRAVGKLLVGPFCLLERQCWFPTRDWIKGGWTEIGTTHWEALAVIQVGGALNWGGRG